MEIYNGTCCVYIHTNKTNGKMYVGQTCQNPKKRWSNGLGYATQQYFYRAIQKYGWDGFEHEIIASNLTKFEADNFEKILIKELKTYDNQFGYNITLGGKGNLGYHLSDDTKQKIGAAIKKHYLNPEYAQKMKDVVPKRAIYQFSLDGEFIKKYDSAMEIERQLGILNSTISQCAFSRLPSACGYIFLFEEDIDYIEQRVEKYKNSIKPRNEHIIQLTLDGIYIREWITAAEAGRVLGFNYKNINAVCRGKRNKAGGYKWMYLSDYNQLYNTK